MTKQFWAVIIAVVVILGAVFAFSSHKSNSGSGSSGSGQLTNHVEGKGTTGVKLVEYGDYECPVCELYYQPVKQVVAQYGDQITFQFRNFPLTQIHQNAFAGARAAEAAGMQNKYWQMHDMLYENQQAWSASHNPMSFFDQYAEQIGLNKQKFDQDYQSSQVNDAINADMAEGNKLGITGTPTFYLDGKQLSNQNLIGNDNQPSVDRFNQLINAEIAKKTSKSTSAGTSSTTTTKQ